MNWLIAVAIVIAFVLVQLIPILISRFLINGSKKHQWESRIKKKTPIGNLIYGIYWEISIGWIVLSVFVVKNQATKGFDVDSSSSLCVMALITIMLLRKLYQSYRSRISPNQSLGTTNPLCRMGQSLGSFHGTTIPFVRARREA